MKITREIKKNEAINRMKTLGIIEDAIEQFINEDIVMVSEPPFGALYWLNDEEKEMVRKFEAEYNALVYLVVRAHTEFGTLDSLFYVSDHKEEWVDDNADLVDGYALTYTVNHDVDYFSEFGSIAFEKRFGGIVRVG